ncbi:TPA: hypothetical protein DDW35_01985 [Candidatus Sumerlaeota bacterium]|jgi:hypothetical protein|nr:hypothetical protein [Candidatus Sumerlaeota bacterium]
MIMLMTLWKKTCVLSSMLLLATSAFAAEPITASISFGSIGLGSWNTQVEFKEIQVTGSDGKVLYNAGELKDMSDWTAATGEWAAKGGSLVQTGKDTPAIAILKRKWGDCAFTFKARKTGGAEGFLIPFQVADGQEKHWWNLGGSEKANQSYFEGGDLPADSKTFVAQKDQWYDIKLEIQGAHVRCYVDGTLMHEITRGLTLIGVGSWKTQVEFKDIQIAELDGRSLYSSAGITSLSGWNTSKGKWLVKDGVITQTGNDSPALAVLDKSWGDCILTLKARKTGGEEGFLILFQSKDIQDKHWWNLGGWANKQCGLEGAGLPTDRKSITLETGRWYTLKIEMEGMNVRCFVDENLIHDAICTK